MNTTERPASAPAISVILPTFNRAKQLPRSAGSVLNQSFHGFELLIVDDGSTDDTRAVVQSLGDSRVRYVLRERNGGVAAARNSGIAAARGNYLAFQDSDDEWLPGKLERQWQALQREPAYGMVVCGLLRQKGSVAHMYPRRAIDWQHGLGFNDVVMDPHAYTQTWLVRRDAVVKAGGFDERLQIWDDWELLMRLARITRILPLPEPLVRSEQSADSLSVIRPRWVSDLRLVLEKHRETLSMKQNAQLKYVLGRLLLTAGNPREARAEFLNSLRRAPFRAVVWAFLLLSLAGPAVADSVVRRAQR